MGKHEFFIEFNGINTDFYKGNDFIGALIEADLEIGSIFNDWGYLVVDILDRDTVVGKSDDGQYHIIKKHQILKVYEKNPDWDGKSEEERWLGL